MNDTKNISRRYSAFSVMQTITGCAPISRASISRQTGLSKQTVSEIVLQLKKDGWVKETGRTKGHVGRTAVTYELVSEAAYIISVDLGGTKVRLAIADISCNILCEATELTDPRGAKDVVVQIARLCKQTAKENNIRFDKCFYAVVGVPGVPDQQTGKIFLAPNISGLDSFDFKTELSEQLGVPVQVENDVNLAVVGEHWAGCAENIDNLAYIALGTGVGAGIMIGGELVRGSTGMAGELGFLPFGHDPFDAKSRSIGALERSIGSLGICTRYKELSSTEKTVQEIIDLAANNEPHAKKTLLELAQNLARVITTLGVVVNPSLIILGGSIGLRDELIDPLIPAVELCFPYPLKIEKSALGNHAALIGGASIGLSHLHQMLFAADLDGADIELPKLTMITGLGDQHAQ